MALAPPLLVTRAAWVEYYAHVSAAADSDAEFAQSLCGPWRLSEATAALLRKGSAASAAIEAATKMLRAGVAGRPALSSGAPLTCAVLVTHADGQRSVERIASDSFLVESTASRSSSSSGSGQWGARTKARTTAEGVLLARLAAAGVSDAVSASLDF